MQQKQNKNEWREMARDALWLGAGACRLCRRLRGVGGHQGWGRLQKPDFDYDYDYSAHKIIDYDYDYDYSGDWKGDYDYDYDYNHPITITITVTCLSWIRF